MTPADRREQITRAAIQTFSRLGIGSSTHAQVAEHARVAIPTVFLYLPNRQVLIDTVLQEVDRYLSTMVETVAARHDGAANKLLAIVNTFAQLFDSETDADYVRIFLDWGAIDRDDTWPQSMDFQDRILATFELIVRDGQDRREISKSVNSVWAAHVIMGSANMIAQMKFRNRHSRDITNFVSALVHGALLDT